MKRAHMEFKKFEKVREDGASVDGVSYGYVLFDDNNNRGFYDHYSSFEAMKDDINTRSLLRVLIVDNYAFCETIANSGGLYVNGTWVPYKNLGLYTLA